MDQVACCSASSAVSPRWRLPELSSALGHSSERATKLPGLTAVGASSEGSCSAKMSRSSCQTEAHVRLSSREFHRPSSDAPRQKGKLAGKDFKSRKAWTLRTWSAPLCRHQPLRVSLLKPGAENFVPLEPGTEANKLIKPG